MRIIDLVRFPSSGEDYWPRAIPSELYVEDLNDGELGFGPNIEKEMSEKLGTDVIEIAMGRMIFQHASRIIASFVKGDLVKVTNISRFQWRLGFQPYPLGIWIICKKL